MARPVSFKLLFSQLGQPCLGIKERKIPGFLVCFAFDTNLGWLSRPFLPSFIHFHTFGQRVCFASLLLYTGWRFLKYTSTYVAYTWNHSNKNSDMLARVFFSPVRIKLNEIQQRDWMVGCETKLNLHQQWAVSTTCICQFDLNIRTYFIFGCFIFCK